MKIEEIEKYVRENYPNATARDIAGAIGISISKVYSMAQSMGLKKSPEFQAELLQIEAERLRRVGVKTRFKPGQTPSNRGKTMPKHVYQKAKATMFAKGHKPHNTKHDGHISIRRHYKTGREYAWVRVREGQYKLLHRVVWEKNNGPIPKGYLVVFKTKNTTDCTLQNLELITREENMRRNSIYKYPEDIVAAIRTNSGLKRRINKLEERW